MAVARARVNRLLLPLADEPKGNLDSKTSLEVMTLLRELDRQGLTVMIVTHDRSIAAYASRWLVSKDGGLRADESYPKRAPPQTSRYGLRNSSIRPLVPRQCACW